MSVPIKHFVRVAVDKGSTPSIERLKKAGFVKTGTDGDKEIWSKEAENPLTAFIEAGGDLSTLKIDHTISF